MSATFTDVLPSSTYGYQVGDGNPANPINTKQGDPVQKTTSTTLTAEDILNGIIVADQGASGAATYTLPTVASLEAALPNFPDNGIIRFNVINIGDNSSEDVTIATNTGWTLVGSMVIQDNATATNRSGREFGARKVSNGAWTLYGF